MTDSDAAFRNYGWARGMNAGWVAPNRPWSVDDFLTDMAIHHPASTFGEALQEFCSAHRAGYEEGISQVRKGAVGARRHGSPT